MPPTTAPALDRERLLDRFTRIRARTRAMFDLLDEGVYYTRPIALRNPIVFYEGHLPAFAVNTLVRKGLGRPGIDARLEQIFERGIDPESEATAVARGNPAWPSRAEVRAYADQADRVIADAIATDDLDRDDSPLLQGAQALWTILEHEEMHQETLAYMWHELPVAAKRKPPLYATVPPRATPPPSQAWVEIAAGRATLGTDLGQEPFAWDNELPPHAVEVTTFQVEALNVTNADLLAFVDAGGYLDARWWREEDWTWLRREGVSHPHFWIRAEGGGWLWRAMFEHIALPLSWPVYVSWAEANAYARWRGARLMTEAEYQRAAYGEGIGDRGSGIGGQGSRGRDLGSDNPRSPIPDPSESRFPWGNDFPNRAPANFDFRRWDPEPVGASPAAASAAGVHDLVGNGWEWTSTPFGPFSGFAPMASYPEYSTDFFDNDHYVLKGASPFTSRSLVRRGLRNWFRPRYPYVYASFRCVRDL